MINQGRAFLRTAWWVGVFPGAAIMLTVLGFNLIGDGLRDALDPRLRQSSQSQPQRPPIACPGAEVPPAPSV